MKTIKKIGFRSVLLVAALASSTAGASIWTVPNNNNASPSLSLTAGSGPSIVTTSAFYATTNTSTIAAATPENYSGNLGATSGGETRSSSPNHALDNQDRIETIMFAFSDGVAGTTSADKVNLTNVNIGWSNGDSDFSVYAYTGTGTPSSQLNLTNFTYTSLANTTTSGWTLVSQNNASGTGSKAIANSTGVYSSYWLIGAYNGLAGSGVDSGDDYFKIASVSGNNCPTSGTIPGGCGSTTTTNNNPEPGTLLLMGAGLLGLTRINARRVVRSAI